jgi:hypothetical protein
MSWRWCRPWSSGQAPPGCDPDWAVHAHGLWRWLIRSPSCAEVSDAQKRPLDQRAGRWQGMLEPFQPRLVRHLDPDNAKAGAELWLLVVRLRPAPVPPGIPDLQACAWNGDESPSGSIPPTLEPTPLHEDEDGRYFILPAHSYGLGVALEKMKVPAQYHRDLPGQEHLCPPGDHREHHAC